MTTTPEAPHEPVRGEDLYGPDFHADPFSVFDRLRTSHPLFWDEVGEAWWLTRYQDVLDAITNVERFSSRYKARQTQPVFGPNITQMEGAEHASRRRVVAPTLVGNALEPVERIVAKIAEDLISRLPPSGEFDLVRDYTSRIPINTIAAMLGLPSIDYDRFHSWYRRMFKGICSREDRPDGRRAQKELGSHIAEIVEDRRKNPRDDIISRIVTASADADNHPYTNEDIQGFVSHLLTAGGETTDSGMANMWSNLFDHSDQLQAVRADPALFDTAFSETLRHDPPVATIGREVLQPLDLYGQRLWPGENVHLSLLSANNDPDVFASPREFNIFRSDLHFARELRNPTRLVNADRHGHLAFGAGEHFCIGYQLARLEVTTAARLLNEALPTLRPANDRPRELVLTPIVRAVRTFPVRAD